MGGEGYELVPSPWGEGQGEGLSMQIHHVYGGFFILSSNLPCCNRRQCIAKLSMLHHHILYLALRYKAAHCLEQQFAHPGGVILLRCTLKLVQQPLDIAPWQHLLFGALFLTLGERRGKLNPRTARAINDDMASLMIALAPLI